MASPFSLDAFSDTPVGVAARREIELRADELIRAAASGEPPITVIAGALAGVAIERWDWRMVDRMIAEWLGPQYEAAGRKAVSIPVYRRAASYARLPGRGDSNPA